MFFIDACDLYEEIFGADICVVRLADGNLKNFEEARQICEDKDMSLIEYEQQITNRFFTEDSSCVDLMQG